MRVIIMTREKGRIWWMYSGDTQSCLLNAGFMHELRQFREGQIIGAEKQGVSCVAVVVTLHLRMVGLLGLI